MRFVPRVLGFVMLAGAVGWAQVQPPGVAQLYAALSDQPATHTSFTLDRSDMESAQGLLERGGLDAQRAAAAVTGITFEMYRFPHDAFYTPEAMASLLAAYKAAGWKHLMNANQTPATSAQPKKTLTDLWLHYTASDIDAVTVLTRGPRQMNVFELTGDLRPLDLLHLSGHFGIPKVDPSAVMVPDTGPRD